MAVRAKNRKPATPAVTPNFRFPLLTKIDLNDAPETRVRRRINPTMMEVLNSMSETRPLMVSEGMLSRRSTDMAIEAVKKAKKTGKYSFNEFRLRRKTDKDKNTSDSANP